MALNIRCKQTKPGLVTMSLDGKIDSDTAPKLDQGDAFTASGYGQRGIEINGKT